MHCIFATLVSSNVCRSLDCLKYCFTISMNPCSISSNQALLVIDVGPVGVTWRDVLAVRQGDIDKQCVNQCFNLSTNRVIHLDMTRLCTSMFVMHNEELDCADKWNRVMVIIIFLCVTRVFQDFFVPYWLPLLCRWNQHKSDNILINVTICKL